MTKDRWILDHEILNNNFAMNFRKFQVGERSEV